ncbi:MAG: 2-oxoacid:acceptor oxidoreductase family protein [Planctomycetota bacterium]
MILPPTPPQFAPIQFINITICGESGEGIFRGGDWSGFVALQHSLRVAGQFVPPGRFQGGIAQYRLRAGEILTADPLQSAGAGAARASTDYCIAADFVTFRAVRDQFRRGSICIIDAEAGEIDAEERRFFEIIQLPLRAIAMEAGGAAGLSFAFVGVVAFILNLPIEPVCKMLESGHAERPGAGAIARKAAQLAFNQASHALAGRASRVRVELSTRPPRWENVMEQIAGGMVASGCRFASGVPDATGHPAMLALERAAAKLNKKTEIVKFNHPQDAAAAALGASLAGVPSVFITNSEGLAAASNIVAHAALAEIPLVVVNIQKPVPFGDAATGCGNRDLLSTIHAGPGQSPRAVLALSDPDTAFDISFEAARIAEEYQIPSILLVEAAALQQFSRAAETRDRMPVARRDARGLGESYRRYESTPSGVSPMAAPGESGSGYVASAAEHDAIGRHAPPGRAREASQQKWLRKLEFLRSQSERSELLLGSALAPEVENYEAVIISWGMNFAAVSEGCALAAREGLQVYHIHPTLLFPLPRRVLNRARDRFDERHIFIFDENPGGDFCRHLRAELGLRGTSLRRLDGTPLRSSDVLANIRELFGQK